MQLRNDYDRNVWNGDVGIVSAIEADEVRVRYDDADGPREVVYDGGSLDELTLAYACTIHKSQGSEYAGVVIPFLTTHFVMLSKNLLYTAVTRGKRLVVLVADPRALRLALAQPLRTGADDTSNAKARGESARRTSLAKRIRDACGDGVG
jgi:exodeoxyribonuclease V alpha subunit